MERAWRNIACLIPMMSGFVNFFEYGASMAQYNLFNPNRFNPLAYDGAIPLLKKGGHETIFSFYQDVFMRVLCKTVYSKRSFVTSQARSA